MCFLTTTFSNAPTHIIIYLFIYLFILRVYGPPLLLDPAIKTHKKDLAMQYPTILTSRLVNNPYSLTKWPLTLPTPRIKLRCLDYTYIFNFFHTVHLYWGSVSDAVSLRRVAKTRRTDVYINVPYWKCNMYSVKLWNLYVPVKWRLTFSLEML